MASAATAGGGTAAEGSVRDFAGAATVEDLTAMAKEALDDLTFPTVADWTARGGKAVGCFPVYTPQELIHSFGMLPVSLYGGGEFIEITHADAPLGSFLCSISKSTLELAITKRLDNFSAFIFPYICDVSRNLEGIFSRLLPEKRTHMLHLPQNFSSKATVPFLVSEYGRLIAKLEEVAGRPFDPARLSETIKVFNTHRALVAELAALKRDEPWRLTLAEHYLINRLGTLIPREVHTTVLRNMLKAARARERKRKDSIRVLLVGPFCEQPSLELLHLAEEVGCYVVGDELQMLHRWYESVEPSGDPLRNLAAAYVDAQVDLAVRKSPTTKEEGILSRVKEAGAQGVIFFTAKFCEPALEDFVLYKRALDKRKIPYLHMEFEEKSSAYEQSRLELETFVESIMFD